MVRNLRMGKRAYIVAEIGQNHNGEIELAEELIDAAINAGADAVKFCKMDLEKSYTKETLLKPYLNRNSFGRIYGEHRAWLEFTVDEMRYLKNYTENKGIDWFCSVCDVKSFNQMKNIGNPIVKIPSREISNKNLIKYVFEHWNGIILVSFGLVNRDDLAYMRKMRHLCNGTFVPVHCVSEYPTKIYHLNLETMFCYDIYFSCNFKGYSSHVPLIDDALAAVALGAMYVEKHLTLDRNSKGTDHKVSLLPHEFKEMVLRIRRLETMLGRHYHGNIVKRPFLKKQVEKMKKKVQLDGSYKI